MCGKCLRQRKNWLAEWCCFVEVNEPGLLDISMKEYDKGIELKIYKLTNKETNSLNQMVI
tara:strand:+ start:2647 stop:2826 length:180 start_codon:yes stop_codon:yes gene_type:complete